MKLISTIHKLLVFGKKLRSIRSRNDTTNANSKNIRAMVPLQCSYLLPVILAPLINTYPAMNKKNAVAKFKGVILNFIWPPLNLHQ